MVATAALARFTLAKVVALALPPRCPGCGVVVDADHRFCADCWSGLRFLGDPACAGCGVPFAFDRGDGARCDGCEGRPPVHDGARAAVAYGPVARDVALKLKYGGRLALATTMGRLMARHVPTEATRIVPVPLHRWRLWTRGYNQAGLIAAAVARQSEVPLDRDLLRRTRATPPLKGVGPGARARIVQGAFAIADPARAAGQTIVLIDDVQTSGATTDACARELKRAGAARVHVLCWAKVLPGEDD